MTSTQAPSKTFASQPASTEAPHPPKLAYLDASGNLHEIFISPGRYAKAVELLDAEDWDALSEFPRWSDQPPLGPRQPDVMMYKDGKGIEREIFLPEGKAERAVESLMKEDWTGLETEFEIYCQSKAFALRLFNFCIVHVHMLTRWTSISAGQRHENAEYHCEGVCSG